MRINKWTLGLAAVGLVSFPDGIRAEERMNPVLTALTPTVISGYVNTSVEWAPGTGNTRVPSYIYGEGKQDGFNLNVVSLELEKPLDEAQWAAGYKVQLWFGPDANVFGSGSSRNRAITGVDEDDKGGFSINDSLFANNSDVAIRQAFVALRAPVGNGLDFKVGVFDSIIGYESHDAHKNPNYTRSYGTTIEPHTHTGVLMSYQFNQYVGATVGIANTHGPAINERANGPKSESYKTYMGSIALTAPDDWGFISGSTLYAGIVNGFNSGWFADQVNYYAGVTLNTPVTGLRVGASYDYAGTTTEFRETRGGDRTQYANAVAIYTSYQATEKLSLHFRGEYASTDTALLGNMPAAIINGNSEVLAATATVQYDLWANVISRLEFRWDHLAGDGDRTGFGGDRAKVSSVSPGRGKDNFYTLALNVIYRF